MLSRSVEIFIEAFWKILLPGLTITIPLTIVSFAIGMVIAVAVAMVQFANVPVAKQLARFYVWVIRGTPLLVQLFVVFFGFPHIGIILDPFTSAVIVFSISTGAYCSETIRGSLESVPHGQIEAGYCVGMSYLQIMRRIVMPQALRTAFPALSNSVISLLKDTSLASIITVTEMMTATKKLMAFYYEPMLLYLEVGMIYLIFSTVLTKLQRICEKRLSSYGKNKG
ncbi:MAG: amino acid ABC transporter permease [Clostridia bacterium]|nr:amino acid ABC transporter permease [Clostridia bacterium]